MRFEIQIHAKERVLEIVYPSEATAEDVSAYEKRCKELILMLGSRWNCLVNQTSSPILTQALLQKIAGLNKFAAENGMQRCGRVIGNVIGNMQAQRIARGIVGPVIHTFSTRAEAWAWLTSSEQ